MTIASGKDGGLTVTGAGSGITVTKWELAHTPEYKEYMTFGASAPANELIYDNWAVTVEGFLTDGGTPPQANDAITDLELIADGTSGYTCSAAVVSSATTTADAGDAVAISLEIKPNGTSMTAYGTIS